MELPDIVDGEEDFTGPIHGNGDGIYVTITREVGAGIGNIEHEDSSDERYFEYVC